MTLKAPSETFESNAFARWLSHQTALLYSKIPIGDNTLTDEETGKLKAMGVRRGVPDFVMVHRGTGRVLWVEMKRRAPAKVIVSDYQKRWLNALKNPALCVVTGSPITHAYVAYGSTQAKDIVRDFYRVEGLKL